VHFIMSREGKLVARSGNAARRFKASLAGSRNTDFLKLVERTEGAFQSGDDTAVEEVRRILADVRAQYDQVHLEAERREAEIATLREQIRAADRNHGYGADESSKKEDSYQSIEQQWYDIVKNGEHSMRPRHARRCTITCVKGSQRSSLC